MVDAGVLGDLTAPKQNDTLPKTTENGLISFAMRTYQNALVVRLENT